MKKLYEYTALVEYKIVIAADSEKEADCEVRSYEKSWATTGKFHEVVTIELVDIREPDSKDVLDDLAHVVL